ncbi:type 1 glutamine amidotransferase [Micromonospora chersina]|uniref:type 1 glutamine amidotransferase n=1 Tax=Micromonospora chersina TaxID=47854 RepID=UPI00371BC7E8
MRNNAVVVDNGSLSTSVIRRLLVDQGWSTEVVPVDAIADVGPSVHAVVLTGTDVPVRDPLYDGEVDFIRRCPVPLLGICGGHQLIGRAFGVDIEQTAAVVGRSRVRLHADSPLNAGLPAEVELFQRHTYGLRAVPDGFVLTATSDSCAVEGIRHRTRELYGMQAHLEFRAEGRRIFRAFLDRASDLARTTR